jgi:Ran GTPase-activating protein (RanGAP) involved in mRNA processing and transport
VAAPSAVKTVEKVKKKKVRAKKTHTVEQDAVVSGVPYFAPAIDSSTSESDEAPPRPIEMIEQIPDASKGSEAGKKSKKGGKKVKKEGLPKRKKNVGDGLDSSGEGYPGSLENAPEPKRKSLEVRVVNADFVESGTAYPIKVNLPTGEVKVVNATMDFSVKEFFDLVMDGLGMWQCEIWSLCRRGKDGQGSKAVAYDGVKYGMINVVWLDFSQTLEEAGIRKDDEVFLKVKWFKSYFKLRDLVAVEMYYAQVKSEVLSGLYPIAGSKVAVRLAALQLQVESGDFSRARHKPGYFSEEEMLKFVPQQVLARNASEYIQQRIFFYHRRLVGSPKASAQLAYIVESRSMTTWGAMWFDAKLIGYKNQASRRIVVGVCEDGYVVPLKIPVSEEEEKQRTISRRKLIESARTNSIMQLGGIIDVAELGKLNQKADDDQYEFFAFSATYVEETKHGLLLKKKGEEVELGLTKDQINLILQMTDDYTWLLAKSKLINLNVEEVSTPSPNCPNYRLFEPPMDRRVAKKEKKSGKTMLEMFKENYLEVVVLAKKDPLARLLLQIEAKLDEKAVLNELDLRRCGMNDEMYTHIQESIAATFSIVKSSTDISFKPDLNPQSLLLSFNDLCNPPELGEMVAALRIAKLDLRSNNLTPKWASSFAKALVKCTGLVEIYLGDNRIGNDGAIDILNSLIQLPALRCVSLSNVGMENGALKRSISKISSGANRGTMRGFPGGPGPEMGKIIASLLTSSQKLERLDISDNVLASRGMDFIVSALEKTDSLRERIIEINFGNTHISGSVGERLASWLLKTVNDSRNHLSVLDLNANAFTSAACTIIADLFTSTTIHLSHVDLSHLKLPIDAISSLLTALQKNQTLIQLSLASNEISSKNCKVLGNFIQHNNHLIKLSLRNCNLDKHCVVALGDAIGKNSTLLELDCAGNNFEAAACGASWEAALKRNKTLTQLNLAACNLDGDSIENLATALKVNRSIQLLHLDANYIGSRGLKKLAHSIKDNPVLRILSLQDVDCKYRDTCEFISEITSKSSSSSLQTIDLRFNSDLTSNVSFIDTVKAHPNLGIRFTHPKH